MGQARKCLPRRPVARRHFHFQKINFIFVIPFGAMAQKSAAPRNTPAILLFRKLRRHGIYGPFHSRALFQGFLYGRHFVHFYEFYFLFFRELFLHFSEWRFFVSLFLRLFFVNLFFKNILAPFSVRSCFLVSSIFSWKNLFSGKWFFAAFCIFYKIWWG